MTRMDHSCALLITLDTHTHTHMSPFTRRLLLVRVGLCGSLAVAVCPLGLALAARTTFWTLQLERERERVCGCMHEIVWLADTNIYKTKELCENTSMAVDFWGRRGLQYTILDSQNCAKFNAVGSCTKNIIFRYSSGAIVQVSVHWRRPHRL